MSWFDDFLDWTGGGEDIGSALDGVGSDVTIDDILGGTDSLLDSATLPAEIPASIAEDSNNYQFNNGNTPYGADDSAKDILVKDDNTYQSNGGNPMYGADSGKIDISNKLSSSEKEKGMFEKTTDFLSDKKNSEILKMGASFGAGLINRKEKSDAENKAYERKLEERAYNEKIQKEKEDRADARRGGGGGGSSAMEMLAAKDALEQAKNARFSASITGLQPQGLINKGRKLTYVGGKPVYTNDGKLN
jgi:hypothetical protein